MIEKMIKKMLRKWLKKKIYQNNFMVSDNKKMFDWVYDAPLKEWRERIWVVKHANASSTQTLNKGFDYIQS